MRTLTPLGRLLLPIRRRLVVIMLLVVAVPVVGVGLARFYEREMLAALEDDMVHQGRVVAAFVRGMKEIPLESHESRLRSIARDTRTRIRLIDPAGDVRADSHRGGPPEGLDDELPDLLKFASDVRGSATRSVGDVVERYDRSGRRTGTTERIGDRPEVKKALAGRYGAASRLYANGGKYFLFSALPIDGKPGTPPVLGAVYLTRSTNPVRASMYRIRGALLLVGLVSLLTALVIATYLGTTIAAPLERLTDAATAIADGDRRRQLDVFSEDEIGRLADAFRRMRTRLDARADELASLAATISHEFKTPLTGLRGAAELLLDGAADDPASRTKFLKNILDDTHRLDRLVTRLLELSRVEADTSPEEPLDLRHVVTEACDARHAERIDVVLPPAPVTIRGRRAQLVSAVGNLVDNALQHRTPGTPVTVTLAPDAPPTIRVHNQGEPIPAANLPRLWERFFTTRPGAGGTGLGLPIVAAVARGHGGSVSVERAAGKGTTFAFSVAAG